MNKEVTISDAFKGVWSSLRRVCAAVGRFVCGKDRLTFVKLMLAMFVAGLSVTMACVAILVVSKTVEAFSCESEACADDEYLVGSMYSHEDNGKYHIYDNVTGEILLDDLEEVTHYELDTLAMFKKDGKWGYFDCYSGKIAIACQYDVVRQFSEGLAAVNINDEVVFINNKGEVKIDKDISDDFSLDYIFSYGLCILSKNGKYGLVNKNGDWVVEPNKWEIEYKGYGFWSIPADDGMCGLVSSDMSEILPAKYKHINVYMFHIATLDENNVMREYDFKGNILRDDIIAGVNDLTYQRSEMYYDKNDETWKLVQGVSECKAYYVMGGGYDFYYGLMSSDGRRITKPIYDRITAISRDRYLCSPHGVILNSRGEVVK